MEKHEPKNNKRYARSQLSTRRCDYMMHGQGVSSLRLGTLGARPPPQSPQLATKDSTMEMHGRGEDAGGWLRTRRKCPPASLNNTL